ncbi:monofunctional biosynthetic peptidoglycan transglycosylase [Pararhodobacter oceanensis]|uniref:Biosynthetic peptidoglycan transglycosylase n=1 Tax=Pararhodobacter oceanensis TaxID=2172121 RepID=A0A2T8HVE8_9RHOB|nr:monofunctional biosynthetic peptidoglycan transglycosylase [Pararhodobacter oceanensis]
MAKKSRPRKKKKPPLHRRVIERIADFIRRVWRYTLLGLVGLAALLVLWVALYRFVDPPGGIYMWQESRRLGEIQQSWVDMEQIAPVMARSVVAAEDANFCRHWGFDMSAIRQALAEGSGRGASTLSQQVVKNVFLWQGRSWIRKALEAVITPMVEILWPKRRIIEVYLNIAEFGEGVFGVEAASHRHFDRDPIDLSARQAALLAAVLPAPQVRNAGRPTDWIQRRAAAIVDGAATIDRDDRAACFQP